MTEADRTETFLRLLAQHERLIGRYVLMMVVDWDDAQDILQETNVVLWREFDNFELGTNFGAWACKIAFHQILTYRKKRQRDKLQFSEQFYEAVAKEAESARDRLEVRSQALNQCVAKLQPQHSEILRLRYMEEESVEEIAEQVGRTVTAVYRVLSRIRQSLHECVSRSIPAEAAQ